MKTTAAFGTWPSEITAELMCSSSIGLSLATIFNNEIYWLENRPQEQGRSVIVKLPLPKDLSTIDHCQKTDVIPAQYNCRTQVHEYGGACYLPTDDGVFFVNHLDQQVYKVVGDSIEPLTLQDNTRFADFAYSGERRMLVAVAEVHGKGQAEPDNTLVSICIDSGKVTTLAEGHDFYASAAFSADGKSLSWLSWDHPNMPWDGTELWLAGPMDAEFGLPQWVFGMRRYDFIDQNTIVTSYSRAGVDKLAVIDIQANALTTIPRDHSSFQSVFCAEGLVCYIAQSPTNFPSVYVASVENLAETEALVCQSSSSEIDPANFSQGTAITYPTAGGGNAHGFYYPPTHVDHRGRAGELPPLIVMIHYTTLAALALTDTFKAGASLYGVTDLTALATDTHKFESRYLDSLIGPYPAEKALYESRSPINHADSINCPVIFLQGLDDKVVPPSQAEKMIEVLLRNEVKVAYLPFEGEGHGFRKSDSIIEAFAAELWFYGEVFGFGGEPVEGVEFLTA